jgi:UPF0755 protein
MRWTRYAAAMAVAAIVIAGAGIAWFWYAAGVNRALPASATEVVVERGTTFGDVARKLVAAGVIDNRLTFRVLARLQGEEAQVRAGEYRFAPHLTQSEVLRALVNGGAQVAAWVTIPEGFTVAQIGERLQAAGIGSAVAFARAGMAQRLVVDGVRTKNLEGFLFPSTYLVPMGATPEQAAGPMIAEFFKQLPPDAPQRSRALHVTVPQAVTIASLVEREAKSQIDRPRIAEVIYNRLRLQMPLQVDATIEYALPEHKSRLSFADLRIDSPYNTYRRTGLPPTPIANPGKPSLEAALHPSQGNDLYYVYCGHGRHVFAATLAQHEANVARCSAFFGS